MAAVSRRSGGCSSTSGSRWAPDRSRVAGMGLLDKILGRAKDTAREVGEQAAPMAEKAGAVVGGAVEKARDVVADRADDVKGAFERVTGHGSDAAAESTEDTV